MTVALDGLRCLVTGGSRGLGRAICVALSRGGARVAFTFSRKARDAEDARAAIQAASPGGLPPLVFQGSVADAAHARATVDAVLGAFGGVDVLINNAGMNQILPVALIEESDWDQVMNVNVKGAFLFSRAVLKSMIRARRGHILFIGSFSSERMVESPAHYAASKSALRGLTESLSREMGKYNIQVNLLAPGLLDVGMTRALPKHRIEEYVSQCPAGRLGGAEEIAEMAAWLVSPHNSFMTGGKIVVDGGL